MQREPIPQMQTTFEYMVGGSVATWIRIHDNLHADLLRSLLVLQGELRGDANLETYTIPRTVAGLHMARARIPPECRATDPDRLVAACARRCMKNTRTFPTSVPPRPSWSKDN